MRSIGFIRPAAEEQYITVADAKRGRKVKKT